MSVINHKVVENCVKTSFDEWCERPDVKVSIAKMAQQLSDAIDAEIVREFTKDNAVRRLPRWPTP